MNGIHDLGGMDGFGAVEVEADEPVFHHTWERRVFGMAAATSPQRAGNVHAFRHAIERMDPAHYLASPYYEHWLTGMATLMVEAGVITRAELEQRAGGTFPLARAARVDNQPSAPSGTTARYAVGSQVRVRNVQPLGHTRCPRYVRGRSGIVTRVDRRFPLPDVAAHAAQRCTQYTYNVRFAAAELWGADAGAGEAVHVDLWESYLETP